MSETTASPQLSGKMFLFERPELINRETHEGLGIVAPEQRFGFCAGVRAVPITVSEIPSAMKTYPIVFAGPQNMTLLAVLGLIDDVNLFVDEEGNWERNTYIPGYIRRYPFGVATETGGDRIAIVLDGAYNGLQKTDENPLYENGEPSAMTQQAIDFCKTYEEDRARTDAFAQIITAGELAKGQSVQFTPSGETQGRTFAEYFGIDENTLNELPDDKFLELRKNGVLPLLNAMLLSMGNWRMLLQRRATRHQLADKDILTPAIQ